MNSANTMVAIMSDSGSSIERVVVRLTPDGRLSRNDAAAYLGLQPKTLAMWALRAYGPPTLRVGNRVFYRKTDLDEFIGSGSKA